jgi:hypothetical protein
MMIWSLVQPVQSRPLYNELSLKDTESTPTNTTCSTCNPKQQTDAFDHEFYTPPPFTACQSPPCAGFFMPFWSFYGYSSELGLYHVQGYVNPEEIISTAATILYG